MITTIDYNELDDDDFNGYKIAGQAREKRREAARPAKMAAPVRDFVAAQDDTRGSFHFTYRAARFEAGWLLNSLGDFYEHQWISDVLKRVKGGKEASVYLCQPGSEVKADLIAAKVYRPRSLRNMKNDHAYREGRQNLDNEGRIVLNDGMLHAMAKRTEYGKNLLHQSWISYEFTSMQTLFEAGADVPQPFVMADNAILMDFVGDLDGSAPTLSEVSLDRAEARSLFERVLHNIELLLAHGMIHGDLSAYNILYWEGGISLIDFPQVISPSVNRNAYSIFQRDVKRVCEYFSHQGIHANPQQIANDLWTRHGNRISPEVDIRLLDAEDPGDRALWKKQKNAR